jgi:release factor glutamine methyltransferase
VAQAGVLLAASALPLSEARALLAHVLAVSRESLIAHPEQPVEPAAASIFGQLAARRRAGEPLAYLLERREFYGRAFVVTPEVLVPRPETELIIDLALRELTGVATPAIADLGTGSGCIALTLALERPDARLVATDISAAALRVAERNASVLNVANVAFLRGSWFEPLPSGTLFDLIISNPPYIALGDPHLADLRHEPSGALTAGVDGLDGLRALAAGAATHLKAGGALLLEHGFDQQAAVRSLLAEHGWREVQTFEDAGGQPRNALARLSAG